MRILRSEYVDFCQEQAVATEIFDATETSVTQPDKDDPLQLDIAIAENELQTYDDPVDTSTLSTHIAGNELQTYDESVDTSSLSTHIAGNELQTYDDPVDTSTLSTHIAGNALQTYDDPVDTSLSVSTHGDETQFSMPENCRSAKFTCDAQQGHGRFHLEVNVFGRNKHSPPVNIVVQFFDPDAKWFTRFYRKYEGKLWYKLPREPSTKWRKWYYRCYICEQLLCSFPNLKGHLNLHLSFYPNRCMDCPNRYATRNALYSHRRIHQHID